MASCKPSSDTEPKLYGIESDYKGGRQMQALAGVILLSCHASSAPQTWTVSFDFHPFCPTPDPYIRIRVGVSLVVGMVASISIASSAAMVPRSVSAFSGELVGVLLLLRAWERFFSSSTATAKV